MKQASHVKSKMVTTPPIDRPKLVKEVSVMVWIENQFGDVLLLKQKRGRKLWTLPGGKVRRRENLLEALHREVMEETGLKVYAPKLCGIFERAEKDVLTFLFRAKIRGANDTIYPDNVEIEGARYASSQPRESTPSLKFFWKQLRVAKSEARSLGSL